LIYVKLRSLLMTDGIEVKILVKNNKANYFTYQDRDRQNLPCSFRQD